ncbi:hypothetical protein [Subtercola boreus]|uniref:hypothetical protein n=1 Tax=Subtercola boreus TaxID=120213 RepID=UPI0011C04878|nr:hypothetical protein [Subtercola boreus]
MNNNDPVGTDPNDRRLQNKIADWVRAGASGYNFMLGGDETPGQYTLKNVQTRLLVGYIDFASTGNSPTPANGATQQSFTPTLHVDGANSPENLPLNYLFRLGKNPSNPDDHSVFDSGWQSNASVTVPAERLEANTTYYWRVYVMNTYYNAYPAYPVWPNSNTYSFTTNNPAVTSKTNASPSDKAVVATSTPTFSINGTTHPNNLGFTYNFRITTGTDALTGSVLDSGWQTGTTFTPSDPTSLQDGGTYTWTVLTKDSTGTYGPFWVSTFTVNWAASLISDSGVDGFSYAANAGCW